MILSILSYLNIIRNMVCDVVNICISYSMLCMIFLISCDIAMFCVTAPLISNQPTNWHCQCWCWRHAVSSEIWLYSPGAPRCLTLLSYTTTAHCAFGAKFAMYNGLCYADSGVCKPRCFVCSSSWLGPAVLESVRYQVQTTSTHWQRSVNFALTRVYFRCQNKFVWMEMKSQ